MHGLSGIIRSLLPFPLLANFASPAVLCLFAVGLALFCALCSRRSVSGLLRQWIRLFDPDLGSAHALSDGLLLEIAYCCSLESLWSKFEIMLSKLGFSEVSIESKALRKHWRAPEPINSAYPLRVRYRFGFFRVTVFEFVASRAVMDTEHFRNLSLVAAKAWIRAAEFWKPLPGERRPPDIAVPGKGNPVRSG
jgi:hypothetical protein